jgi:hypothetical protein
MKKLIVAAVILLSTTAQMFAGITVGIVVSTKSHWDGSVCAPTEKGCCIRIFTGGAFLSKDEFGGNIFYDRTQGLVLTLSKKDLGSTLFSSYFGGGTFLVDADSPISSDVLQKISFSSKSFTIKQGKYQYSIDGDIITIIIPTISETTVITR